MSDEPSVPAIPFQRLREALGRGPESDMRVGILILIAKHAPVKQEWLVKHLEGRLGATAPNIGKHAARLEDQGFVRIDKPEGSHPSYHATPLGRRIALGLDSLQRGSMASDLLGRVLVTATRAREDDSGMLRAAMLERAQAVLTGFGSLAYVAICEDDPSLVEELQGRIERQDGQAAMLRISQVLTR